MSTHSPADGVPFNDILEAVAAIADLQTAETHTWHQPGAVELPEFPEAAPAELAEGGHGAGQSTALLLLAARHEHLANFQLWHVEDTARRRDVDAAVIADCKRTIDGHNQRRNDFMEKVDGCLLALLGPHLPGSAENRRNTESPGAAVDRLSILALKIFHMAERADSAEAAGDAALAEECQAKLSVLQEQREDLRGALIALVDDYRLGRYVPNVYYQFKMYNDPRLNPELYAPKDI